MKTTTLRKANHVIQTTRLTVNGTLLYISFCLLGVHFPLSLLGQSNYANPYTFTTLAGSSGNGGADGNGSTARFSAPWGVTVDNAGNLYVADTYNNAIRKVTSIGAVATLAGLAGNHGSADATRSAARFYSPVSVAVDSVGNVYAADSENHTIRKVTPAGVATTLAGLAGSSGSADGIGSSARFNYPWGVGVDTTGNLYVGDLGNHTIRKVTSAGEVTTLAGLAGSSGSLDGAGSAARFYLPRAVAVDRAGNLYVADSGNNTIRKVTPAGAVTTLAGSAGNYGSADGTGNAARFSGPAGVAVDSADTVYVGDYGNFTIRKVTPTGVVTTLAGLANRLGSVDGTGSTARFSSPAGVAVDSLGNVYVADSGNNTVRKVAPTGEVTTLAGLAGGRGAADGAGSAAQFNGPWGMAGDGGGNFYVADFANNTIRKMTSVGAVTTLAGLAQFDPLGHPLGGSADGTGSNAKFNGPSGLAVDSGGNIYVADSTNNTIRKVTSAGEVTTLAGLAGSRGSADGTGTAARFYFPQGVAAENSGNLYVTDTGNHTVRKVTSAGEVTTLAGLAGSRGTADGTGSAARFAYPWGLAVDTSGNLYVADLGNSAIRKITSAGLVTTLAGGSIGSADGTGTAAQFYHPWGVAVDSAGNVYVADNLNNRIRRVTPGGAVTTIAGGGYYGSPDGTGSAAQFSGPTGVAVDSTGNVYVAEAVSIRKGILASLVPSPILNQSRISNGQFGFEITGLPGLAVSIESLGDMSQWEVMGTYVLDGGTNSVVSPIPPIDMRFYRARLR